MAYAEPDCSTTSYNDTPKDYFTSHRSTSHQSDGSLEVYLANIKLSECLETLRHHGFTSLKALSFATINDLEYVGILKGHAIMIIRAMNLNFEGLEAFKRMGISHDNALMMLRAMRESKNSDLGSDALAGSSNQLSLSTYSDNYKPQVWGVNFWLEASRLWEWQTNPAADKPEHLFPKILAKFAPGGAYMMALATDRIYRRRGLVKEVDAELLRLRQSNPKISLGLKRKEWDKRLKRFVRDVPSKDGAQSANAFREFLLFLSRLCSNGWVTLENDGSKKEARLSRPGLGSPDGEHTYLPDNDLEAAFRSVFRKHTEVGNSRLPADSDARKTSHFLTNLVEAHKHTYKRGEHKEEHEEHLFYKLVKDAVIATLHFGSTGLEYYRKETTGVHFWHIIAKLDAPVGWPDINNKNVVSDLYKVRFKAKTSTEPGMFVGMWPLAQNYCDNNDHLEVTHVDYDFDQDKWEGYFGDVEGRNIGRNGKRDFEPYI